MAINFPTSPTTNDIHSENNLSWKFNGSSWIALPTPSVAGNVAYTPTGTGAVTTDVETKLRESVSVKDFGAVGDGVTDDTVAIQAAINASSRVEFVTGDVYRVTSIVTIPSDRVIDINWATIKRDFAGEYTFTNAGRSSDGSAPNSNIVIQNGYFRDCNKIDGSDFGGGIGMAWVSNVKINNVDIEHVSTQPTLANGAWAIYMSGEDITMDGIRIENSAQVEWADGVHLGYVKMFRLTNFNINAGDDAIALVVPPEAWSYEGDNSPSTDVVIGNGICQSVKFAGIKIGTFSSSGYQPPADSIYKNVLFHDIVIGQCGSAPIMLEDDRAAAHINNPHDHITFDGIRIQEQATCWRMFYAIGNPDFTDVNNVNQHNFKNVILKNVTGHTTGRLTPSSSNTTLITAGGVSNLVLDGVELVQDFGVEGAVSAVAIYQVVDLSIKNSRLKVETASNAVDLKWVENILLVDFELEVATGSAPYRGINLNYNNENPISFFMFGGRVVGAERGVDDFGTSTLPNPLTNYVLSDVYLESTINDDSVAIYTPSNLDVRRHFKTLPYLEGSTGGSGSAGAGNQYIPLTIDGTTYKVLHDGTV